MRTVGQRRRRFLYKFVRYAGLIEQAKPYLNDAGLVVERIPGSLFCKLRMVRLAICAGDLLPPNIEGLQSRWFVVTDPESSRRITTALSNLRKMRGDACPQTR